MAMKPGLALLVSFLILLAIIGGSIMFFRSHRGYDFGKRGKAIRGTLYITCLILGFVLIGMFYGNVLC